jgi:hypothetical protein
LVHPSPSLLQQAVDRGPAIGQTPRTKSEEEDSKKIVGEEPLEGRQRQGEVGNSQGTPTTAKHRKFFDLCETAFWSAFQKTARPVGTVYFTI